MIFREQKKKEAAEQYKLSAIDEADLHINYEEDSFDAGVAEAIGYFVPKAFVAGEDWADKHLKNPWIDTRDCKGSDSAVDCILILEGGGVTRGYYNDDKGWLEYPDYKDVLDDVCYWMDCDFFKD